MHFQEHVQMYVHNLILFSQNLLIPDAEIINLSTERSTNNNANGEFSIAVKVNDSILIFHKNYELKGKFGEYKTEIIKIDNNKLVYKRSMFLNKGKYSNKEYDEYRLFMEQVSRNDNTKIILTKI